MRYLWTLRQLDRVPTLSGALRDAVRLGLQLADTAGAAHDMQPAPHRISSAAEAHAAATVEGGDREGARAFIERQIRFDGKQPACREPRHAVADRATMAYAAATLIALGQLERGVALANAVTRQFNDQGGLYSTVDSVAAIALMIQLHAAGIVSGDGKLRVPLVVTSRIEGKQRFAVCMRNMFEEERAASPGLLSVDGPGFWG